MNKTVKKILSITLGLLFVIFLILLPQILLQGTVLGFRFAEKVKNSGNRPTLPIATIQPVEKSLIFHFLPGSNSYVLDSIDTDATNSFLISGAKDKSENNSIRTPAQIIQEANDANIRVIVTSCTESARSCEYSLEIAKLAKQSNHKVVVNYDGCLHSQLLSDILPYIDVVNLKYGAINNTTCGLSSYDSVSALKENLNSIKLSKKLLEITYSVFDNYQSANDFLETVSSTTGKMTIIHLVNELSAEQSQLSSNTDKVWKMAITAGFKYVYADTIDNENRETTFCADGSVAISRQNSYLLKNNLNNGVCLDGTVIPGIWQ